jgi:hypothetical protein
MKMDKQSKQQKYLKFTKQKTIRRHRVSPDKDGNAPKAYCIKQETKSKNQTYHRYVKKSVLRDCKDQDFQLVSKYRDTSPLEYQKVYKMFPKA